MSKPQVFARFVRMSLVLLSTILYFFFFKSNLLCASRGCLKYWQSLCAGWFRKKLYPFKKNLFTPLKSTFLHCLKSVIITLMWWKINEFHHLFYKLWYFEDFLCKRVCPRVTQRTVKAMGERSRLDNIWISSFIADLLFK